MRNTLMAIREALNIDLQVPLVAFRHILNSHALQAISNRKPQQKVKSIPEFVCFFKNFKCAPILLSETTISGTGKDKFKKLPMKNRKC